MTSFDPIRSRPLSGTTILDLGGIGPAPRCVRVLADLGARWIRILPPGSASRPQPEWFQYGASRGVEQFAMDLKQPAAREVFLRMAGRADVVIESFRPGVANRLGVDADAVRSRYPRLVYCSLTGFGQTGPYAGLAGHDLNYQALSGALAAAGRAKDGGPALPGLTLADSAGGGWQAAVRILAALLEREHAGQGATLDVSASEGVLHLMALTVDEHLATGAACAPGKGLLSGGYACYGCYRTADNGWLAVAAIEPKFFRTLCENLELPGLVEYQYDQGEQDRVRVEFSRAFSARSRDHWMAAFAGLDVCVTPVLTIEEVAQDPHWKAREMFAEFEHPEHGRVRQISPFGGVASESRGPAPSTGHTKPMDILGSLGFSPAETRDLMSSGVLG